MAKRRVVSGICMLISAALLISGNAYTIHADETPVSERDAFEQGVALYEKLTQSEMEVPEGLDGFDEDFLKAVILGYTNAEDEKTLDKHTEMTKQDFISVLYKTVINYDASYEMSEAEADAILNECYNNAYIDGENRTAYAFMLNQGVIQEKSDPDEILTWELCAELVDKVSEYFLRDKTLEIGRAQITVGENIVELTELIGEPNRIDKSEYGFDWYIYNENYSDFCAVGVKGGRICAFYTNSMNFSCGELYGGCDYDKTGDYGESWRFIEDDGKLDMIIYNPYDAVIAEDVEGGQALELLDMINAYRSKNSQIVYAYGALLGFGEQDTVSGSDIYSVYETLVHENSDILTRSLSFTESIGIKAEFTEGGVWEVSFTSGDGGVSVPTVSYAVSREEADYAVNEVETVSVPQILPSLGETYYSGGDDVVIELEEQAASEYHIEVFDVENDEYAVNEYIKTDSTKITLPSELFTEGCDYSITVSAIDNDGTALAADEVNISYGSLYNGGVKITSPAEDTSTDNDYMNISWESEAYSDFYVDLYNEHDELIASEILEDEYEALLQGLDVGRYCLYVTALRRGTRIEKAQDYVFFDIEAAEPVIEEIILDRDDVYYFVYEDEDLGVIYLYDEELAEVEENGTTTVKKKIIRKQVKATKGYRALSAKQPHAAFTTGEPVINRRTAVAYSSRIGEAIVSEAEKYLGVNYVWGGTSPEGFDCSGLVQYVLNTLGISIDRVAEDQFEAGVPVGRDDLQAGDLLFFERNGYIHHVGIYAGDGMMIHAPHTGAVVEYQPIDTEYYRREYAGARRVYQ